MSVIFLHPDLGIGGAERAIVDAALAAKSSGYDVEIVTNYHDPKHAFEETVDGSLKITTVCQYLPRSIMGRFIAVLAFLKMILAAIWIAIARRGSANLVYVDQVSAPLILLRLCGFRTIFYGHFPDLLLSHHDSFFQKVYRYPLDLLEEFSTGQADTIVVNSHFTGSIFKETFPSLRDRYLKVLYPVPNTDHLVLPPSVYKELGTKSHTLPDAHKAISCLHSVIGVHPKLIFLSINRYERKKNIELAFESFAYLKENWSRLVSDTSISPTEVYMIHAGGYDDRVRENVEYFEELKQLLADLKITEQSILLHSVPSSIKSLLIAACTCLIYTPAFEHFGIVPVEAMFLGRPVIALDAGGPRETVIDQKTGFLCPLPHIGHFKNEEISPIIAEYMSRFINDPELLTAMEQASHEHVKEKFSTVAFRKQLALIIEETSSHNEERKSS
ncbi:unnamed protein product [Rodentolepis nana]|uniref:Alpha-1,3/1,6-mannosyltransferase ALG2 n=1 Tax=Rodentolepis nana TaxID=102285 RepID=A0A0R3TFE9_RODNA|nr:unnamed protein product [Rodentolepis nana]